MFNRIATAVFFVAIASTLSISIATAEDGQALKAKGLKAWESRTDMTQAMVASQMLEQAAKALPQDKQVADLAVRSYYWLGINATDVAQKRNYHMKGYDLGNELQKVQPNNVGVYYWTASNISRYAQTLDGLKQKSYFTKINGPMNKVRDIDPAYFYDSFNRYLAILTFSMSPAMRSFAKTVRNDFSFTLEDAEKLIIDAGKKEPRYLLNHTTHAEIMIAMGRKDDAKKKLEWVLQQDAGALASEKPENLFEQKRAKKILAELK